MITRGLGTPSLISLGLAAIVEIVIERIFGGGDNRRKKFYYDDDETDTIENRKTPKRIEAAKVFIAAVKEKIMETGIVKDKHKPYDTKTNKRYKVSEKQAARVAYSIAKKEGLQVGKYRGPNKK